jgi:transposase
MQYVGIDLGKDTCSASILDEQGNTKKYLEFRNQEEGWKQLIKKIDKNAKIAMEAGTIMYPIYDYLTGLNYDVKVGHPQGIKAISSSSSKTDKKDSEILANLLRLNYLPLAYIPSKEMMKNREVLRTRVMIGQEISRVKNRIHGFLTMNGLNSKLKYRTDRFGAHGFKELKSLKFNDYRDAIFMTMLTQYESLTTQKEIIQIEIAKLAIKERKVKIILSITGIDFYSALLILSELGDIDRFSCDKAVCKYSGLVPRVRASSTIVKMGSITKEGPSMLRWILSVTANLIVRYNNPLRDFYKRLYHRTKSKKLAKIATARKLLVMIYHMLKNDEECRWKNPELTKVKIRNLEKMCRKKVLAE